MLSFLFCPAPSLFDFACFPYLQITALGERNVSNLWASLIYFGAAVVHLLNQVLSLLWLLLLSSWFPHSYCLLLWVIENVTTAGSRTGSKAKKPLLWSAGKLEPNSVTQWKTQGGIQTREWEHLTGQVTTGYLSSTEVGKIQSLAASSDQ